jgi:hypothetical protein
MRDAAKRPSRHGLGIWLVAAFLAGCGSAAPRQYQTAITGLSSEPCSALQAVVEEREKYGIVAASREPLQKADAVGQGDPETRSPDV